MRGWRAMSGSLAMGEESHVRVRLKSEVRFFEQISISFVP